MGAARSPLLRVAASPCHRVLPRPVSASPRRPLFPTRDILSTVLWSGLDGCWRSSDFRFETLSLRSIGRERKVRTPQGNGLANGQAGRPDDKCNREQTSRWLCACGESRLGRAQVMGETVG